MPIPLGNGLPVVIVGDNYDNDVTGGPSTILPVQTIRRIQFTVANNPVFVNLGTSDPNTGRPRWDKTDIPFIPGTWTLDDVQGIRFRNANSGLAGTVSCVAYLEDDPLPLAVNQGSKSLGKYGQIGSPISQQDFANSAFNPVPSPGVSGWQVEIWGAGGGGGSTSATGASTVATGAGGGGGAYCCVVLPVPLIVFTGGRFFIAPYFDANGIEQGAFDLNIGTGGAAENTGGFSQFTFRGYDPIGGFHLGAIVLAQANGGNGGGHSGAYGPPAIGSIGGLGGLPDLTGITGNAFIIAAGVSGWGARGIQGSEGHAGNTTSGIGGRGGSGALGADGGGQTILGQPGNNGNVPGGGGGGAAGGLNNIARVGGGGGSGQGIITEFTVF